MVLRYWKTEGPREVDSYAGSRAPLEGTVAALLTPPGLTARARDGLGVFSSSVVLDVRFSRQ